jgi:hypothetical protein
MICQTNKTFKNETKVQWILVLLVVLAAQLTLRKKRTVSGTVSDNARMPLPV